MSLSENNLKVGLNKNRFLNFPQHLSSGLSQPKQHCKGRVVSGTCEKMKGQIAGLQLIFPLSIKLKIIFLINGLIVS